VGAVATVFLPDGRQLISQVDGGNGHSGKRSSELHFGLADLASTTQLKVDVRWRAVDGTILSDTMSLTPGRHTIVLRADGAVEQEG
jgi:hypothetical protein